MIRPQAADPVPVDPAFPAALCTGRTEALTQQVGHHRSSGRVRLSRLPMADPPRHLRPPEPCQPARARIQGGGTTTTPFDMLMLNDMDRFHLVMDVIDRVPSLGSRASALRQRMVDERLRHRACTREVGDDPPEIREWTWASQEKSLRAPRRRPGAGGNLLGDQLALDVGLGAGVR
jgi:hypothetical protein